MDTLARLTILIASILLCVPPGFCCLAEEPATAAPAKVTCCSGQGQETSHSSSGSEHSAPGQKCCCGEQGVVTSHDRSIAAGQHLAVLAVAPAPLALLHPAPEVEPALRAEHIPPPGPSLQCLQCVWRC